MAIQDQACQLSPSKLLIVFIGLQAALFLSFVDATSVSTILPIVGSDLDAASSITWAGTAFLVANTSFQIISSRLSDCLGRKLVLVGSLALFAFGDLISGFAKNAVWLYCGRAVAGIGGGGINSLSMIIMSDVVPMRERGKYQGLLGISIAGGSAAGPFIGAALATGASWRWAFWLVVPLSVITMGMIWFFVPLKPVEGNFFEKIKDMDWIGSILSLAMTLCILVPLSGGGSTFAWNSSVVIGLLVGGVVAAVAFVLVERFVAAVPLLPGRLFKTRNIVLLLVQTWLVGIVYYGGIYFTPLYLQNSRGYTPIESAAMLLCLVVVQVLSTVVSGYVVKWTGRTWSSFATGFLLLAAGQGAQICFSRTSSPATIGGILTLQGLGIGATLQSTLFAISRTLSVGLLLLTSIHFTGTLVLAQASGSTEDRAVITGARNFARTSGGAIGLAIANSVLNNIFIGGLPQNISSEQQMALLDSLEAVKAYTPEVQTVIEDAYMKGLRSVFIFFFPVVALCFLLCFVIKDIPLETAPPSKDGTLVSDEEQGSKASSEDVAVVESGTAASSLKTSEKCSAKDGN